MAAFRVTGLRQPEVESRTCGLIERWKKMQSGRNTVNLVLRKINSVYEFYIILRNPDHRTPPSLRALKEEGVGVIEAAGEIILPVPGEPELWRRIEEQGLDIIMGILMGNNPVEKGRRTLAGDLLQGE
jgi:hypothetical protein